MRRLNHEEALRKWKESSMTGGAMHLSHDETAKYQKEYDAVIPHTIAVRHIRRMKPVAMPSWSWVDLILLLCIGGWVWMFLVIFLW